MTGVPETCLPGLNRSPCVGGILRSSGRKRKVLIYKISLQLFSRDQWVSRPSRGGSEGSTPPETLKVHHRQIQSLGRGKYTSEASECVLSDTSRSMTHYSQIELNWV